MRIFLLMALLTAGTAFAMLHLRAGDGTDKSTGENQTMTEDREGTRKAMFGAGCFWGVETAFKQIDGVIDTDVGYSGGHTKDPTYRQVCSDSTGHAEVVLVWYDPARVSYETLLSAFWKCHNPTTFNRQGPDVGSQVPLRHFLF